MCGNSLEQCWRCQINVWVDRLLRWYLVGQFCTFWDNCKISRGGHIAGVISSNPEVRL